MFCCCLSMFRMIRLIQRPLSMAVQTVSRLIWVDCEMTGLNYDKDTIVEIAAIVTDEHLNIVAEGPNIVINQNEETLNNMNEWCKETFAKNGLTQRIRDSTTTMEQAEEQLMQFLAPLTPAGKCQLAGNSVSVDRVFIEKKLPRVGNHLHYRTVDVSTIKELCYRWYPQEFKSAPKKAGNHRALDDIKESINELKYYRSAIFK